MADRFGFVVLKDALDIKFAKYVNLENVLKLLPRVSSSCNLLIRKSYDLIDVNATSLVQSEDFLDLPEQHFIDVLSRDTFDIPELEIFETVQKYIEQRDTSEMQNVADILACVRLSLIPVTEIFNKVEKSNYFSAADILKAVKVQTLGVVEDMKPRGQTGNMFISIA